MVENRSRYAILGALTIRPMSGYDLRQFFARSVSHFWQESYGQIYPMLKALDSAGLVTQLKKPRGQRRIVYQITPRGRATLAAWLSEPVDPVPGRTEILLKLFFIREAPPKTAKKLLASYREKQEQLLARYEAMSAQLSSDYRSNPSLPYWLATLSFGSHVSRALVQWSVETEESLSNRR